LGACSGVFRDDVIAHNPLHAEAHALCVGGADSPRSVASGSARRTELNRQWRATRPRGRLPPYACLGSGRDPRRRGSAQCALQERRACRLSRGCTELSARRGDGAHPPIAVGIALSRCGKLQSCATTAPELRTDGSAACGFCSSCRTFSPAAWIIDTVHVPYLASLRGSPIVAVRRCSSRSSMASPISWDLMRHPCQA